MRPASYRTAAYGSPATLRQRIASAGLALGLVAALLFALLTLGILPEIRSDAEAILTAFDVDLPETRSASAPPKRAVARAEPPRATPPPPPRPTPPLPPRPPAPITLPNVIPMTREQLAAADIGTIRSEAPASGAAAAPADGGATAGRGEGPGGATLFNADWQREPTRAEMSTYIPKRARTGWGLIACRTAPRNRVTDCRILDETPGSGIARGLREAAWQFLIVPPRVDGQPVIGAWVRIRFDLTTGAVS